MDTAGAIVAPPADDESILIELDLTTEWTPIDAAGPSPRPGFWITLVLAPLLLLTLLAGGARTRTLDPMFELGIGTARTELIGNILYLTARSPDQLRAYDIRDGRLLWRRSIAEQDFEWARYGDVLAITAAGAGGGLSEVTALDGPTGRELWRLPAAVVVGGTAGILAIRRFSPPAMADASYSLPAASRTSGKARVKVDQRSELLGVDARTGKTSWERTLPVAAATFTLTAAGSPSSEAGGVLVIDSQTTVRAVDPGTGRVLTTPSTTDWQLPSSEQRLPESLVPCLVYLSGAQAGALDSRAVCLPDAIRDLVSRIEGPPVAGRRSVEINDDGTIRLLDSSGAVVRTLHGWAGAGTTAGGSSLIVSKAGGSPKTGPILAALNAADGRLRVLARLPVDMPTPTCTTDHGYLLCHGGSKLGVWRLETSKLP